MIFVTEFKFLLEIFLFKSISQTSPEKLQKKKKKVLRSSPVLNPGLNPERHVNAPDGLEKRKVLGRVFEQVAEGPDPGLPDKAMELPHTELPVIVLRDLDRRLQLRPRAEILKNSLLHVPVLASHVLRQRRRLHAQPRHPPAAFHHSELLSGTGEESHSSARGEVERKPFDSPSDRLELVLGRAIMIGGLHFFRERER